MSAFNEYSPLDDLELLHAKFRRDVEILALSFTRTGAPLDDLEQTAYVALLELAHRFEPDRGIKFSTFARKRLRGAFQDAIDQNRRDNLQGIPRPCLKPSILDELHRCLHVGGVSTGSDASRDSYSLLGIVAHQLPNSASNQPAHMQRLEIFNSMQRAGLDRNEQTVIYLRYTIGDSWNDIAEAIGLSEIRAFQIHRSAKDKIRQQLGREGITSVRQAA